MNGCHVFDLRGIDPGRNRVYVRGIPVGLVLDHNRYAELATQSCGHGHPPTEDAHVMANAGIP